MRFWQTINPFNTRADGMRKTSEDIYAELATQLEQWRTEPIVCCEMEGPQ